MRWMRNREGKRNFGHGYSVMRNGKREQENRARIMINQRVNWLLELHHGVGAASAKRIRGHTGSGLREAMSMGSEDVAGEDVRIPASPRAAGINVSSAWMAVQSTRAAGNEHG